MLCFSTSQAAEFFTDAVTEDQVVFMYLVIFFVCFVFVCAWAVVVLHVYVVPTHPACS
jgi:hypothetical protein